jgi:phosphoribosylcarboxyaminoimidazole (NCAIR) mutase
MRLDSDLLDILFACIGGNLAPDMVRVKPQTAICVVIAAPGFPVGTLALDKAGARNAAWLAAQILALSDPELAVRLKAERAGFIAAVEQAAAKVEAADAERRAK